MTGKEAIGYIESQTWSTTRLGLDRTRTLLAELGNPQKRLKFIHVAGSNGKGSTCAMLASIMCQAGYRTGLYTSPYICRFNERIQIDCQEISDDSLTELTEKIKPIADGMTDHPSQFELVTALAMQYFADKKCDIVVLEVGLGGELDSTNVIDSPEVAVITNIGLEHTEYLGNTLEEIASAKGGIIKTGCAAVCYDSEPEVMATLQNICTDKGVQYIVSYSDDAKSISCGLSGQKFMWKEHSYSLPLIGEHQLRNAAVALETISVLRSRDWSIPEPAVEQGLLCVKWPARFEILSRDPLFILDGGHNPQCAHALANNLRQLLPDEKLTFLMGVLEDKDYEQMLEQLLPFTGAFVCITPDSPRALPADRLARLLQKKGFNAQACSSIEEGILRSFDYQAPVIAFGSLYMAGHVRGAFLGQIKKWQRNKALAARDAIPAKERAEASARICRRIAASTEFMHAKTIMIFKAFRSEVDLSLLEEEAERCGKLICYPYCADNHQMFALHPNGRWQTDQYGILTPVLEESSIISPGKIDLVLCPCAAFDSSGNRLGMGAGYYDRFLPNCSEAYVAAVAFEAQRLPSVASDVHDYPVNTVFTESLIN